MMGCVVKTLFQGLLALVLWGGLAHAHALQPGYLELKTQGDGQWSVFFRKPDVQGRPMQINATLSAPCDLRTGPDPTFDGEGWSTRWITQCPGGLSGVTIDIQGLEKMRTDVLVRYELRPGEGQAWRLMPSDPSFQVPQDPGPMAVMTSYGALGIEHILFGVDHLLFVLVLLLLIRNWRVLIGAVTAFTVAHSLTLGAAALGWLTIPGPPVEAIIALSIMFVAAEVLNRNPDNPRLSERAPWVVAFCFGLIHGLGFGSALNEIGLPQNEIVLAVLSFNIGVEAGQLLFIATVLIGWSLLGRFLRAGLVQHLQTGLVYGIGGIGAFWMIERIAGF